jgi:hypothetical protein
MAHQKERISRHKFAKCLMVEPNLEGNRVLTHLTALIFYLTNEFLY